MRIALTFCFALLTLAPVSAEVFRPQGIQGARGSRVEHRGRGGSRGGHHFGGHHGHHYGSGAYFPGFRYYDGYGLGYPQYTIDDYDPYGTYGTYGTYRGSAAANGLLLGALAGGIIGHNSGDFRHNGWRGAAWGAGAGWLLGTIADTNRRVVSNRQPELVAQPTVALAPAPVGQPAAQPVTLINNYHGTPSAMSPANGLFGR